MLKSNISSSLGRKHRISFWKKAGFWSVFALFIFSLCIFGLTLEKMRITEINITGNRTISAEEVLNVVEGVLSKRYLFIIPTDNLFLIRRFEIRETILNIFKKVNSIKIIFHGLNNIEIVLSERIAENLWCDGKPNNSRGCFFMDKDGFVFAEAPNFSGNLFPKYFGNIVSENPIGESYFNLERFVEISIFFRNLEEMKIIPESFNAIDLHEYEVVLDNGGIINVNDRDSFDESLVRLKALIDDGLIKTDTAFLSKIKHIDLRYGNKVHYDFRP